MEPEKESNICVTSRWSWSALLAGGGEHSTVWECKLELELSRIQPWCESVLCAAAKDKYEHTRASRRRRENTPSYPLDG